MRKSTSAIWRSKIAVNPFWTSAVFLRLPQTSALYQHLNKVTTPHEQSVIRDWQIIHRWLQQKYYLPAMSLISWAGSMTNASIPFFHSFLNLLVVRHILFAPRDWTSGVLGTNVFFTPELVPKWRTWSLQNEKFRISVCPRKFQMLVTAPAWIPLLLLSATTFEIRSSLGLQRFREIARQNGRKSRSHQGGVWFDERSDNVESGKKGNCMFKLACNRFLWSAPDFWPAVARPQLWLFLWYIRKENICIVCRIKGLNIDHDMDYI